MSSSRARRHSESNMSELEEAGGGGKAWKEEAEKPGDHQAFCVPSIRPGSTPPPPSTVGWSYPEALCLTENHLLVPTGEPRNPHPYVCPLPGSTLPGTVVTVRPSTRTGWVGEERRSGQGTERTSQACHPFSAAERSLRTELGCRAREARSGLRCGAQFRVLRLATQWWFLHLIQHFLTPKRSMIRHEPPTKVENSRGGESGLLLCPPLAQQVRGPRLTLSKCGCLPHARRKGPGPTSSPSCPAGRGPASRPLGPPSLAGRGAHA